MTAFATQFVGTAASRARSHALQAALASYSAILFLSALDAYNIGPIPLTWLAQCLSLAVIVVLPRLRTSVSLPGIRIWSVLLLWSLVVTISTAASTTIVTPELATTSYPVFVSLRFLNLASFTAQIYLVWWLQLSGARRELIRRTVQIGGVAAVFAIYVYAAHRFGLPEPPRTRLGTSGGDQAVTFTYAFHRALGSFREPSDLAAWLLVPMFLAFTIQGSKANWPLISMSVALLLSGSLAAVGGGIAGAGAAFLLVQPLGAMRFSSIVRAAAVIGAAACIFGLLAAANDQGSTNLIQVLTDRIRPILEGGAQESNRHYLVDYYSATPVPLVGTGIGNANLHLSDALEVPLIVSFLSLYSYILYSTGWIGGALLLTFLLRPVSALLVQGAEQARRMHVFLIASGYGAWLVMFIGRSEEPTISFAIAYGLLAFESAQLSSPKSTRTFPSAPAAPPSQTAAFSAPQRSAFPAVAETRSTVSSTLES